MLETKEFVENLFETISTKSYISAAIPKPPQPSVPSAQENIETQPVKDEAPKRKTSEKESDEGEKDNKKRRSHSRSPSRERLHFVNFYYILVPKNIILPSHIE